MFDYVDAQVSMLRRVFEKRLKGYRAIGYEMDDPTDHIVDYVAVRFHIAQQADPIGCLRERCRKVWKPVLRTKRPSIAGLAGEPGILSRSPSPCPLRSREFRESVVPAQE